VTSARAARLTISGMRAGLARGSLWLLALLVPVALLLAPPGLAQPTRTGAPAPDLAGGPWINSAPLTLASLRGRVVAVEFWTYG
jgi:hypothetical protein